ncbi:MAG: hypothetical protein ACI837_002351 [Crocinitomicaceae bacterium]|jgi:hypothetical protein
MFQSIIAALFIISNSFIFCQVPIEFCHKEAEDISLRIYNFPETKDVDTASIWDKKYANGQSKWAYFLNDSLRTDSLISYHQNGTIACRTIISHYTPFQGEWEVNYMPSYYTSSFYPSGKLRSEEFNNYLDRKWLSIKKTYLDSSLVVYSTRFIYGDTLEGVHILNVLQYGREPIVEYGRYKDGILLDKWSIKGHMSEKPIVMKIRNVSLKKEFTTDEEIQLEMKNFCFYYKGNHFGILEKNE